MLKLITERSDAFTRPNTQTTVRRHRAS